MENFLTVNTVLVLAFLVSAVATLAGLALSRSLLWRSALVVAVLTACGAALYPPGDKLKLGIDLDGGTSLLYDVTVPEGANRRQALENTIEVLKRRVDPDGIRNIGWMIDQSGRIEVQMPRPSKQVTEKRKEYDDAMAEIVKANVRRSEIEAYLDKPDDVRREALKQLVRGIDGRGAMLSAVAETYDALKAAKADHAAAGDPSARASLALKVADAQSQFDQAMEQVLATSIDPQRLQQVLAMPTRLEKDDEGNYIPGSSPREQALSRLIERTGRQEAVESIVKAHDAYRQVKGPLEDPEDLKRLLRGAGVLEFRIAAAPTEAPKADTLRQQLAEHGPRAGAGEELIWMAIDNPAQFANGAADAEALRKDPVAYLGGREMVGAEYGGEPYILLWNSDDKAMDKRPEQEGWGLRNVRPDVDDNFFPAVSFSLNARGAQLMSAMSGANVGRQMAIILDGRVVSAPSIQQKLSGGVRITGGTAGFSPSEQRYLVNTLKAGSLDARLSDEPISETKIGSQFGEDNLTKGLEASRDALIIVAIFMMIYYFFAGAVADAALLANIVIILGIMAFNGAAFTLPGIAGVVLTIGMCVDANVLVFERIREELERGNDIATAMRLGYSRALSAIIDGNITNLIVCVILYQTASADVRGFAVTLGIGICATLFTSLFMTRVIFDLWAKLFHIRKMRMLPMVLPPLHKLLSPSIKWVSMRWLFFGISATAMVVSLVLCFGRGIDLLDIEFRGGTLVTFELMADPADTNPDDGTTMLTMELNDVRQRVNEVGNWFRPGFDPAKLSADDRSVYDRIVVRANERREELKGEWWKKVETQGNIEALPEAERAAETEKLNAQFAADAEAATDLVQLGDATIVAVGDMTDNFHASQFKVATTVSDSRTVAAVIKLLFAGKLDTTSPLRFTGKDIASVTDAASIVVPITKSRLTDLVNQPVAQSEAQDISQYLGGVAIMLRNIDPPTTVADVDRRIKAMRLQPDYEHLQYRDFKVIGLTRADNDPTVYTSIVVVSRDPNVSYFDSPDSWEAMAQTEWKLTRDALDRDLSLSSVSNFTPTVAHTIQQQAIVAMLLSLIAIIAYIWFRFGSLRFGLAACVALVHDVVIAMGFIAASTLIYKMMGSADNFLLIEPYRINLALIAALLTIVGYSLNDTIVVFDRIRENRGKLAAASSGVINDSINQTISRTILTSGTTLLAVVMLYVFGGEGVREFAFALVIGVTVGTYSSVAVAAPILTIGLKATGDDRPAAAEK